MWALVVLMSSPKIAVVDGKKQRITMRVVSDSDGIFVHPPFTFFPAIPFPSAGRGIPLGCGRRRTRSAAPAGHIFRTTSGPHGGPAERTPLRDDIGPPLQGDHPPQRWFCTRREGRVTSTEEIGRFPLLSDLGACRVAFSELCAAKESLTMQDKANNNRDSNDRNNSSCNAVDFPHCCCIVVGRDNL